jgi:hypothetical protein
MIERFTGTVEHLCSVEIDAVATWIGEIPLEEWPQQRVLADRKLRPAMVTDHLWYDFGHMADPIVRRIMHWFAGCAPQQWMLSAVMPGHSIPPHRDEQSPNWLCRVHVPITTNPLSLFIVGDRSHNMKVGEAYRVNTEARHSVTNNGETPRIHFMFDVMKG